MSFLDRLLKRKPKADEGLFGDLAQGNDSPVGQPVPQELVETQAPKAKGSKERARVKPKPSATEALPVEVIADETGKVLIAFGVRWRPLVQAGGREAGQQLAAKAKASHYILRTQLLGYGILPKQYEGQIYPAAALAAKAHAGTAIYALSMGHGQYWLALARNGQPTNTDEVITGATESQVVDHIRAIAAQFAGESISVFSDIRHTGIEGQRAYTLRDIFDVIRTDADRLQKLPPRTTRIPKPVLIATILGAVALAGQKGYSLYQDHQRQLDRQANAVVEEEPEAAWKPVVEKFAKATSKGAPDSLMEVRKLLSKQPVMWAGWNMNGARCQAGEIQANSRNWTCQANYDRSRIADTSEQMLRRVKDYSPGCGATFPNISSMVVVCSVKQAATPIDIEVLAKPDEITLKTLSFLQGYLPVLVSPPEFKMLPHELAAPLRKDGKPHAKPATVPNLYKGVLVLRGPMRSIDVLAKSLDAIEWDSIGIVTDIKSSPDRKAIRTSAVTVELAGKVFGKK